MTDQGAEYARRAYLEQARLHDGEELVEPDAWHRFVTISEGGRPQLCIELRAGEKRLAVVRCVCTDVEVLSPDNAWVDEDGVYHEFNWGPVL